MLVTGNDDYAIFRAAGVAYDLLASRGVYKGPGDVYKRIKGWIDELRERDGNGDYFSCAGLTVVHWTYEESYENAFAIYVDVASIMEEEQMDSYVYGVPDEDFAAKSADV